MKQDFLFRTSPASICHAPTIEEVGSDILVGFFAGADEHDTDVEIYISRYSDECWSAPQSVANGRGDWGTSSCWNPVLYRYSNSELFLFYKVGPTPDDWWGMLKRSSDGGISWSEPERLPDGVLGPTKNKPLKQEDGSLLIPSSDEAGKRWAIHLETFCNGSWKRLKPLSDPNNVLAIQPCLLSYPSGEIQILSRTTTGKILENRSTDRGKTWSTATLLDLPNPNSALDAVVLRDGRSLLVYNPTENSLDRSLGPRTPLITAISEDEGKTFRVLGVLEDGPGEFSYPSVIQTKDGQVQIVYTYNRENIKRVILDANVLR